MHQAAHDEPARAPAAAAAAASANNADLTLAWWRRELVDAEAATREHRGGQAKEQGVALEQL